VQGRALTSSRYKPQKPGPTGAANLFRGMPYRRGIIRKAA
jgi:hypothetical protein